MSASPAAKDPSPRRSEVSNHGGRAFVGRESETEALLAALGDVISGRGSLLLIGGEPGIGKTTLAEEFSSRAKREDALVLWGRCWEGGGAPAYWPWTQSMRGLLRELDLEELRTHVAGGGPHLAQMLPELREMMPDLLEAPRESPEVARFRLFDALSAFLRRVSGGKPMLVVLEDLHAADASSLLLLRFLADEIHGMRLLLLATYRDVELTRDHPLTAALPELTRAQGTVRMSLSGLGQSDVARFIHEIVGQIPPEGLVAEIHRGTEGNPLFVSELVGLLSAEGRLGAPADARRWPIPEAVREVIGRRLDRLPEECRRILMVGSVMGPDFPVEVLKRIAGRSTEEVLGALHVAVRARIVAAIEDDPGRFRFTHVLIREVLYEDFLPADKIRAHREVGEALEALYAGDPEPHVAELAHHFFEAAPAGDLHKAVDYAAAAGKRAVALLAYEEAVRLFRMALRALRESPDEERRCEVLLLLGDAAARSGDTPASKEAFLRAAEIATRLNLAAPLARAALGYAGRFPWVRAGIDRQLIPLLNQALDALGSRDSMLRVRLLSRLAGALRDQPSMEPRATLAREAVAMARRIGDPEALTYALLAQWAASMGPDGLDKHGILGEELDRLADEVGDREVATTVHAFRFATFMAKGEVLEARIQHELASRLAAELRQPNQRWLVGLMATILALQDGRFEEAERLIDETFEAGHLAQEWDAGAARLFSLFVLRREEGRLAELEEEIRRAPIGYPGYRSLRCMLLTTLCDLGRLDEARALFEQLAANDFAGFPKDNEWLFALTLLAEAAHVLRDRPRAGILYEQLRPYAGLVAWFASDASAGPVSRPLGLLASLLGRHEDATRHFEDAIERAQRMEARPWAAHAQYAYAEMLAERSRPEDSDRTADLLTTAMEVCEEIGMIMLGRRVKALMARLGVHPRSRPATAATGGVRRGAALTPREREVAGLVAEALSNRQIAERLYLSERTVESHVQNILAKLGMTSRTQVAVWALNQGLDGST